LALRNSEVDIINDTVQVRRVSGASNTYFSADVALNEGGIVDEHMPQEYLNIVTIAGLQVHELEAKILTGEHAGRLVLTGVVGDDE
jgi:hypothetical protein